MKFGDVFAITAKVLGALFLISIGIGVVYTVIEAAGDVGRGPTSGNNVLGSIYIESKDHYDKQADEKHSLLPESKWHKLVSAAIGQHCPVEGMTKEETEKAVGKPQSSAPFPGPRGKGEVWIYEISTDGGCLKYDGERCSEHKIERKATKFYFSPNGNLTFSYEDDLFGKNCYSEPFYSDYLKPLAKIEAERNNLETERVLKSVKR
jgi:hypothetical protein